MNNAVLDAKSIASSGVSAPDWLIKSFVIKDTKLTGPTDRTEEVPTEKYTIAGRIAAYKPWIGETPANVAYERACGIRVIETVKPAHRSDKWTSDMFIEEASMQTNLVY